MRRNQRRPHSFRQEQRRERAAALRGGRWWEAWRAGQQHRLGLPLERRGAGAQAWGPPELGEQGAELSAL